MDVSELIKYLVTPVAQVALIIALAEVAKQLGLKNKFIPLLDLGLGIISGIIVFSIDSGLSLIEGIIVGIACGLSACGLFSGIKNLIEKK